MRLAHVCDQTRVDWTKIWRVARDPIYLKLAFENPRGNTASKNKFGKDSVATSGVREKTYQPLTTPRKALNPLQNTANLQKQQAINPVKPSISVGTKPTALKPSKKKSSNKLRSAPVKSDHDIEDYPEIENTHFADPLKMELEDLPFTTPNYIFNLKKWTPRLYSSRSRAGSEVKDVSPWTEYSYEQVDNLKSSNSTSNDDWPLPFDVPEVPDIPDLDIL
ncbi:uncharacterized protein [Dysidea avara]|uniref:uncharacterized protein n=1 Tax=Dysidea avara TaxID=196820 RepID=UPI00332ADA5F